MVFNDEIKQRLKDKREGTSTNGYLVCKKCRGYYKLKSGEYSRDFTDKCACGDKLRYSTSIDVVERNTTSQSKQQNTEDEKESKKSINRNKDIINSLPVAIIGLFVGIFCFWLGFYLFGNMFWNYIIGFILLVIIMVVGLNYKEIVSKLS